MTGETRPRKAPPVYRAESARRILAGHMGNLYGGLIGVHECCRNLRALAVHGGEGGDEELFLMAIELAGQLEAGLRPDVIFPTLDIPPVTAPALEELEELQELEPGRCEGKTKRGKPCKSSALAGSLYCRAHQDGGA